MDIESRRIHFFERQAIGLVVALKGEVAEGDIEAISADAAAAFAQMVGEIPYADRPDHVMAQSVLSCYGVLAFHGPLRERGYDSHVLGRATINSLQTFLASMPSPDADAEMALRNRQQMQQEAVDSQDAAAPDEFVFEMLEGDADTDYGMNILSCAICHAYAKYDAMDLVPYMCASDDTVSDAVGQGLRRTGTIALGAHHCDFRFKQNGPPRRLEEQYPDRIRLRTL